MVLLLLNMLVVFGAPKILLVIEVVTMGVAVRIVIMFVVVVLEGMVDKEVDAEVFIMVNMLLVSE